MAIWDKVSNAWGDMKVKNRIKTVDGQVRDLVLAIDFDNINDRQTVEEELNKLIQENSGRTITEEEAAVAVVWGVSRYVEDKGTNIIRRVETGNNPNEKKAADKLKRLDIASKALLELSERYQLSVLGEQHRPEVIMYSLAILDRSVGDYQIDNNSQKEERRKKLAKEFLQAKRDQNEEEMNQARRDIESELQEEMSSSLDYLNNLRQEAEKVLSSGKLE